MLNNVVIKFYFNLLPEVQTPADLKEVCLSLYKKTCNFQMLLSVSKIGVSIFPSPLINSIILPAFTAILNLTW